jgi:branched-chain amino acid transport system substrate-binding protein
VLGLTGCDAAFRLAAVTHAGCSKKAQSPVIPGDGDGDGEGGVPIGSAPPRCGTSRTAWTKAPVGVVHIYSSLPMRGVSASQAVPFINGIRLALTQEQSRAGRFAVDYEPLDDATAAAGHWDAGQTAGNAEKAASDPKTVYYIGDLDSAADAISIPILNRAGIAQVGASGSNLGSPRATGARVLRSYFPTDARTYLSLLPPDPVQAAADLDALSQDGCSRLAVAADRTVYGRELVAALKSERRRYGIDIALSSWIDPASNEVAAIERSGVGCVEIAGTVSAAAVRLTDEIHAALPKARILGSDGMCTASWTDVREGGVTPDVARSLICTAGTPYPHGYTEAAAFRTDYRIAYGVSNPDPSAFYGYEAMRLALDTIANLGPRGDIRAAVLKALRDTRSRASVLGRYGFGATGYTTARSFGLYRVGRTGDPVYVRTLTPASAS